MGLFDRKNQTNKQVVGLHYFQDTNHYTGNDINTWLPELKRMNVSWLVLKSDATRAIPEQFLNAILEAEITPIIQFSFNLPDTPSVEELRTLLEAYKKWGVKYVVFFDKPNDSSSWSNAGWNAQNLVERFIDRFLPLAIETDKIGLVNIFPPLQPGGSYWDTSFFKSSLQSLQRRGYTYLLEKMVIGSYAYTFGHELTWGQGGNEKWTKSKPYQTPKDSQDQRGFNNFVWLKSIASSLGFSQMQVIQFGAGIKDESINYPPEVHAEIVHAVIKRHQEDETSDILACNFWLLSADIGTKEYDQAWIKPDGDELPVVRILAPETKKKLFSKVTQKETPTQTDEKGDIEYSHPIEHYLLMPVYEWGISDWHLDVARSFIKKYKPTIGYSIREAALAKKVTVIGGEACFSDESISSLRDAGCVVDQICGDGTSIATQLLER